MSEIEHTEEPVRSLWLCPIHVSEDGAANCPRCGRAMIEFVPSANHQGAVAVLEWLVSMDDPDDPAGLEARRTVTLTQIIERARTALGEGR